MAAFGELEVDYVVDIGLDLVWGEGKAAILGDDDLDGLCGSEASKGDGGEDVHVNHFRGLYMGFAGIAKC